MSEIFIEKRWAEVREVGFEIPKNMLRVWCEMYATSYCFQIRVQNPLKGRQSKGKNRNFLASFSLSIEELESILVEMKKHASGCDSVFTDKI